MAIDPKKTYTQTPSKLRFLWEIAKRLIANYENFDRRLTDLEKKASDISSKIKSTADKIVNV
jgi:hypothetical protein